MKSAANFVMTPPSGGRIHDDIVNLKLYMPISSELRNPRHLPYHPSHLHEDPWKRSFQRLASSA